MTVSFAQDDEHPGYARNVEAEELLEALQNIQNAQNAHPDVEVEPFNDGAGVAEGTSLKTADEKHINHSNIVAQSPVAETQEQLQSNKCPQEDRIKGGATTTGQAEASLENPKVGNPISHGQVIDLSKQLKAYNLSPSSLDVLLRGARVYVPPPPSKPEPTSEYKALMTRLRREEELRAYERMTNPISPMETFAQRFPAASAARAFSSSYHHISTSDLDDDDVTYADVDRQMALILNVLVSIVACAGAIWVVARWWSTPTRLALSMGGSLLVGVAEVVVYSGYIRRVAEAKANAKGVKDVKEVLNTWVIGAEDDEKGTDVPVVIKGDTDAARPRRRKNNNVL
ncbi:uncharacterized protein BP5553_08258 [Venustampulla echinocandica]|uniref:Vacuolar h+-atpase assembly protein n=1 Tax=Venustampulla echinocandica TaxID=2656787 RepID=A0A370TG73_9HELO|nr:uncharacterized protein BP5553_08258 [Venustampulla echinocandica]RDL33890.1 hypothetical protein BP5553_08258 [Venustampulla echinocandica]